MRVINFLIFFLIITPALLAQTEKDSLLKRDADGLIGELRFIYELDQSTRKYLDYVTFDKSVTDSIEGLDEAGKKKAIAAFQLPQETKNRLWKNFLSPLDSLKAIRMLEIIKIYGYPSVERLEKTSGQDVDFNPTVILVHTPFNFKEELIPILQQEYEAGNIPNRCEYGYLLWHLHGRSDFNYMLENGYKMETRPDGTFNLVSTCE